MIVHKYPYTNLEEQNLDWIIAQITSINTTLADHEERIQTLEGEDVQEVNEE